MSNAIEMPSVEVMLKRVKDTLSIKLGSDPKRVVMQFIGSVADRELNAHGVNLQWEFSVYEIASKYGAVPMLAGIMSMEFNDIMEAILVDQPEFLAEVLAVRQEIIDAMNGRK
jgi:hypothetical protein